MQMKTTFISSHAIGQTLRTQIMRSQSQLAEAQVELSSGRLADVGNSLGASSNVIVHLRQELGQMNAFRQSTFTAEFKLDVVQSTLQAISFDAEEFIGQLIAARDNGEAGAQLAEQQARAMLVSLVDKLGITANGSYLMGGINSGEKPVSDYWAEPTSPSRASVHAEFLAEFGFHSDDVAVSNINSGQIENFFTGAYASLFDEPAWSANWSVATDEVKTTRITRTEEVQTSISANHSAIRKLALVYTAVSDLGTSNLSKDAFESLADMAIGVAGEALHEISTLQASIGVAQERTAKASVRHESQSLLVSERLTDIEGIDAFEASTRVNTLLTQIETSYAVTARIQGMSILNFI